MDTKTGTYTVLGSDGVKKVTEVFETPGSLYQKVKSIEEISGTTTNTIYRASYDEAGRLIRKIDTSGYMWKYSYDKNGRLQGEDLIMTQETLDRMGVREKWLIQQLSTATFKKGKENAVFALALFYLQEMKDFKKALALIPQLADRNHIYALEAEAPFYTKGITLDQRKLAYQKLLTTFPDKKAELSAMFNQ